jgi:hypothetical protein
MIAPNSATTAKPSLLKRDADSLTGAIRILGNVDSGHLGATRRDRQQRRQHANGRRPAPLGPRKPKISQGRISRSTPRTASTVPSRPV